MRLLIPNEEIVEIAKNMGEQITKDYQGKQILLVCVLKGACPFFFELIKHIDLDVRIDFIHVSSYVGTESTGVLKFKKDIENDIAGREVIVVEDIVDTGFTLTMLNKELLKRKPKSLTYATLLDKPSKRKVEFVPKYIGKTIDDLFVIGFGLDLDEKYRNLKDIYIYNED